MKLVHTTADPDRVFACMGECEKAIKQVHLCCGMRSQFDCNPGGVTIQGKHWS